MRYSEGTVAVTAEAIRQFAAATGDWNPVHFDNDAARRAGLPGCCAHGLWIVGMAARQARAAGVRVRRVTARFERPALVGTVLRIRVEEREAGFTWTATDEGGVRLAHGEFGAG